MKRIDIVIYRMIVEGSYGSPFDEQGDASYVFFSANTKAKAIVRAEVLFDELTGESSRYDWYNLFDEIDLKRKALKPNAFEDAFLFESGCCGETITYCADEAILFLVGEDRQRVLAALEKTKNVNAVIFKF
jgi:hypothetical protein